MAREIIACFFLIAAVVSVRGDTSLLTSYLTAGATNFASSADTAVSVLLTTLCSNLSTTPPRALVAPTTSLRLSI
jgi:hypothetical protein